MRKITRQSGVTPAEFQVLRALWDLGAGTVTAIHAALPRKKRLAYNTVLTQVRQLHSKGYLQREAVGRAHVYRSRLDRPAVLRQVLRQFVDTYYDGSTKNLADSLSDDTSDVRVAKREPTEG